MEMHMKLAHRIALPPLYVLAFVQVLALGSCGEASGGDFTHSGGASGVGGEAGGGAPQALPCPASNLTRACNCDNGTRGRQVCIETVGWQGCDCGGGPESGGQDGDLNLGDTTPAANTNVAIQFTDYVKPANLDSGDCRPGNYVGTFQCFYVGDLSPDPFEVNGVVSFTLDRSANSEVLVIKDGVLDGWGIMFFLASLHGNLDCGSAELTGDATEGFYNPFIKGCSGAAGATPGVNCVITDRNDPAYAPWTVSLEGNYQGSLDPTTDTISGNWSLIPDLGGSCDGTFTVTYAP